MKLPELFEQHLAGFERALVEGGYVEPGSALNSAAQLRPERFIEVEPVLLRRFQSATTLYEVGMLADAMGSASASDAVVTVLLTAFSDIGFTEDEIGVKWEIAVALSRVRAARRYGDRILALASDARNGVARNMLALVLERCRETDVSPVIEAWLLEGSDHSLQNALDLIRAHRLVSWRDEVHRLANVDSARVRAAARRTESKLERT